LKTFCVLLRDADAWFAAVLATASKDVVGNNATTNNKIDANEEKMSQLTRKVDELSISLQLALEKNAALEAAKKDTAIVQIQTPSSSSSSYSTSSGVAFVQPSSIDMSSSVEALSPPPAPPGAFGDAPPPPPPPVAVVVKKKPFVVCKTKMRAVMWQTLTDATGTVFDGQKRAFHDILSESELFL
jgi:hypothetical protein